MHFKNDFSNQAKEWRKELEIAENEKVILFAGKLEPKKNPFFLINLAKELPSNEYKIVFVGSGPLERDLKKQATENCIFLGFQNQKMMPILYRLADIFVLPSVGPGETWGLAINEAMACGIPVIASDKCGGAIDLIDSSNGIVINKLTDYKFVAQLVKDFNLDVSKFLNTIKESSYQTVIDSVINQIQ